MGSYLDKVSCSRCAKGTKEKDGRLYCEKYECCMSVKEYQDPCGDYKPSEAAKKELERIREEDRQNAIKKANEKFDKKPLIDINKLVREKRNNISK